jgi:hypothetical protein
MSQIRQRAIAIITMTSLAAIAAFAAGSASGSVTQCSALHLSAKMTVIGGSRGAGNVSYKLTLKNNGPGSCLINKHPGLRLVGKSGLGLPTHVKKIGSNGFVSIQAGKSVSQQLRFSPDIPGPGEPSHGACEPAAHKIVVSLNPTTVRGPILPPTPVCGHGAIQQKPLG